MLVKIPTAERDRDREYREIEMGVEGGEKRGEKDGRERERERLRNVKWVNYNDIHKMLSVNTSYLWMIGFK